MALRAFDPTPIRVFGIPSFASPLAFGLGSRLAGMTTRPNRRPIDTPNRRLDSASESQ
jgi:hypothetical protein